MNKKIEKFIHSALHIIESAIALISLVVLVGMLCLEFYRMATVADYFSSVNHYLHQILSIVVGLEFVKMLTDLTAGNIIDVLTVAIARQIIVSHEDPISNLCCVACIAGLLAARFFLIPRRKKADEEEAEE